MFWILTFLLCFSAGFADQHNRGSGSSSSESSERVAFFGDSTSDPGNVWKLSGHTWPIVPPYYKGRYCNGPNWADKLKVQHKFNYAYGSATTENSVAQGLARLSTLQVPSIRDQVAQYLNDSHLRKDVRRTVHVVWGGSNDLVAKPSLALNPGLIVSSLSNSIKDLIAANVSIILVFNFGPLERYPANIALNKSAQLMQLTAALNFYLNATLYALQASSCSTKLYSFDLHSFMNDTLAKPPPPIINTVNNCWLAVNLTTVIHYCPDPKKYFFTDPLHMSSTMQEKLAETVDPFFSRHFNPSSPSPYIKPMFTP